MADVKWIKIATDIFDDEKLLMIETLPESDSIILIWFKLLCLAGKKNNRGIFVMGSMPYTDEMFSVIFKCPVSTVRRAFDAFEKYGMIKTVDGVITIPSWDKHQSLDAYERKKERDRVYQAQKRAIRAERRTEEKEKSSDGSSDVASKIRIDKIREEKIREDEIRVDEIRVDESRIDDNSYEGSLTANTTTTTTTTEKENNFNFNFIDGHGRGVVMLTDWQMKDLGERLGGETLNNYLDRLSTFIIEKQARIKSHYDIILKWYEEDKALPPLPKPKPLPEGQKSYTERPKNTSQQPKTRYGDFDPLDAFNRALERSFRESRADYEALEKEKENES